MVYDLARDMIYIGNGTSVVRHHVGTNTLLPPLVLGGTGTSLMGMDISPDFSTLFVADASYVGGEVWVHVIDLGTGLATKQTFPRAFYEGGTYSVAVGSDGAILITSTFLGSGWVPLRRCDPGTGVFTTLASVRQSSMLTASGDRGFIGYEESNISSGPVGRYRVADGDLLRREGYDYGTSHFNYECGVNHNGTQYAFPTYFGTYIFDADLLKTGQVIGTYAFSHPIGVAYHPFNDVVYFAWAETTQVRAHNTSTFAVLNAYDFQHYFDHPGNHGFVEGRLKIAADGSLLLATVDGGVRFIRLSPSVYAHSQSVSTLEDTPVAVTLTAWTSDGGSPSYSVETPPGHGTLSGTPPNLTYTPAANYDGPDHFTFRAHHGLARSNLATVSITVVAANEPPVAVDDEATTRKHKAVVIDVLANDSDPDGDPVTLTAVTQPANGTAATNPDDTVTYTPAKKFVGADSFTYSISDGQGGASTGTVTVTVAHPGKGKGPPPHGVAGLAALPNAMGVEVVFSLTAPAIVRATVLNVAGREVATIAAARDCQTGMNRLVWSGRATSGVVAPEGTYLIRVEALGEDGQRAQAVTVARLRRR